MTATLTPQPNVEADNGTLLGASLELLMISGHKREEIVRGIEATLPRGSRTRLNNELGALAGAKNFLEGSRTSRICTVRSLLAAARDYYRRLAAVEDEVWLAYAKLATVAHRQHEAAIDPAAAAELEAEELEL